MHRPSQSWRGVNIIKLSLFNFSFSLMSPPMFSSAPSTGPCLVTALLQPCEVQLIIECWRAPRDSDVTFVPNSTNNGKLICIVSISEGWGSFPEVQRPGREVNHIPSSHGEIKNEWSYNFTPPIRLHGANRENFTLITIRK